MNRVGFQLQVRKDKIDRYKEVHRKIWPEVVEAITRNGWHRYSLYMNEEGLVFGYFETPSDLKTALAGFLAEEVAVRWAEASGELAEIPKGGDPKQILVELEEVFHLD